MSIKEKIYFWILYLLLGLAIPFFGLYFISTPTYDNIVVYLAHSIFLTKYSSEYQGFFAFAIDTVLGPLVGAVCFCSWIVLALVSPTSRLKGASWKVILFVFTVGIIGISFMTFGIPSKYYPDIIKDFNCVKHGETNQIVSEHYNTYMRNEMGGRFYTKKPVYYLYFSNTERGTSEKSFKIGRDLYEYLQDHPHDEKIIINYMPNTGIFLNIQIGDEKFGTYSEESQ